MIPIGKEPAIQAKNGLFLSLNIINAAIKLAIAPKITSCGPSQKYALPTIHPIVTPVITGHPKSAANGIKQSAIRN